MPRGATSQQRDHNCLPPIVPRSLAVPHKPSYSAELMSARSEQPKIIVVDDDPSMLRALRRVLAPLGGRLAEAGSVAAALALLRGEAFDVLLTDVVLPDGDGCALAVEARTRHPGLIVFYLSGYGPEILAKYGLLDAAARFIEKPFDVEDLRGQVAAAFAAREGLT